MLNHITMFQPSAIDNALSTLQIIHKLINQINVVIDEVNSIDSKANEYTDEKIKELSDNLQIELTNLETLLKNYTDVSKKEVKDYTDEQIESVTTNLNNSISRVYTYIDDLEQSLRNYIDLNDNEIELLIYEIKDELIKLINQGKEKVFSPFDGRSKSIQQALYDIYKIINLDYGNIIVAYGKKWFNDVTIFVSNESENIDVSPKTYTYGNMISLLEGTSKSNYCQIKDSYDSKKYTFIVFDRLDFSVRYPFMVLYYLCFNYMVFKKSMSADIAYDKLSTALYTILGYSYNKFLNTHTWNSLV